MNGMIINAVDNSRVLVAHMDNTTTHVTAEERTAWNGKASVSSATASLTVAGWDADTLTQTVNVAGVTADNIVQISPAPASYSAYCDAEIYCSVQGAGTLTFTCKTVPTEAITMNVVVIA